MRKKFQFSSGTTGIKFFFFPCLDIKYTSLVSGTVANWSRLPISLPKQKKNSFLVVPNHFLQDTAPSQHDNDNKFWKFLRLRLPAYNKQPMKVPTFFLLTNFSLDPQSQRQLNSISITTVRMIKSIETFYWGNLLKLYVSMPAYPWKYIKKSNHERGELAGMDCWTS